MKKKIVSLVLLLTFTISLFIFPFGMCGDYFIIQHFDTDKSNYYIDESITIYFNWSNLYNPINEVSYCEILIYNKSDLYLPDDYDTYLWISERYHNVSSDFEDYFNIQLTVPISNLTLLFEQGKEELCVAVYHYYKDLVWGDWSASYFNKKSIFVLKKPISHEIYSFEQSINFGQSLSFDVRFYDSLNYSNLVDYSVSIQILSNNITIFQNNFYTNDVGIISPVLTTENDLSIASNIIMFNVSETSIYNRSLFQYEVFVNRLNVSISVFGLQESYLPNDDIKLTLFLFYNNTVPLSNENVSLILLKGTTLLFEKSVLLNDSGQVAFNISKNYFDLNSYEGFMNFTLLIYYNGSYFLNNNLLSIQLKVKGLKEPTFNAYLPISFGIVALIIASIFLYYKKKHPKSMKLSDITFKV